MQAKGIFIISCAVTALVLVNGCVPVEKYNDCKLQNRTQSEYIAEIESQFSANKLMLEQTQERLMTSEDIAGAGAEELRQKVVALEDDSKAKSDLIKKMQAALLRGGVELPPELRSKLETFAAESDMVSFDASNGMVKFKSDLLFQKGSDTITKDAIDAIRQLCAIINASQAEKFDISIVGHTDDVPIGKPETRAKHPTNWHLSVHRAISVLNVMKTNKVPSERMSVRGFGQYRPIEANKSGKKGNPKNRRVEIYIVPKGA